MSQEFLIIVIIVNLLFLTWFISTMHRIRDAAEEIARYSREIARYSRRTALSLPLTQGQAKLINRGFTLEELMTLLEKQGAKLRVIERQGPEVDVRFGSLCIDNRECVDPELVGLLMNMEHEAVLSLWKRAGK